MRAIRAGPYRVIDTPEGAGLMAYAEQEQEDDQPERHAKEPQEDQQHLICLLTKFESCGRWSE